MATTRSKRALSSSSTIRCLHQSMPRVATTHPAFHSARQFPLDVEWMCESPVHRAFFAHRGSTDNHQPVAGNSLIHDATQIRKCGGAGNALGGLLVDIETAQIGRLNERCRR